MSWQRRVCRPCSADQFAERLWQAGAERENDLILHVATDHIQLASDQIDLLGSEHNMELTRPLLSKSSGFSPMPRKIRQLIADLEQAGFVSVPGGKGSHRKFRHPRSPGAVILSGKEGDDAHHYQEKQVRNAIREVTQ